MFSQGIPINLKNCTQISIGNKVIMNSTYYNLHSFSLICDCLIAHWKEQSLVSNIFRVIFSNSLHDDI